MRLAPGPPSSDDVGDVIDFLVSQRQPARLTDVAAELGVSTRTVQRALAADRLTFSERHNESRLYLAAHELVYKRAPVSRVGELAGFANTSHFCAVFKAVYGVSPGAFRAAAVHKELASHEVGSPYRADASRIGADDAQVIPGFDRNSRSEALDALTAAMTRDGLELFEELMDDRGAGAAR